jgi:hypothetical protein
MPYTGQLYIDPVNGYYVGVNPQTGQYEPVYRQFSYVDPNPTQADVQAGRAYINTDSGQLNWKPGFGPGADSFQNGNYSAGANATYFLQSDPERTAAAGNWPVTPPKENGGLIGLGDKLVEYGAPIAVGLMGAGAAGLFGAPGAAAAGGTSAGTGGAAAAAGGDTAGTLGGESLVGPATGTTLDAGLQASGATTAGAAGAGAPTISAVASGAGPFVPATLGTAAAGGLSKLLAPPSAAAGGTAGGSAAAASGAAAGTTTALGRILRGDGSLEDYLSALGALGATGLGIAGANSQANAYKDLANQYLALGAPSRARYEASFDPNFNVNDIPGYTSSVDTTTNTLLRQLSAQNGNPFGNPGGLAEALKYVEGNVALPAIESYRNQNAATGGYNAFSTAAPSAAATGVGAQGGVYNALGYGLGQVTNPPTTLADYIKLANANRSSSPSLA